MASNQQLTPGPIIATPSGVVAAPAGAALPNRFYREIIDERRGNLKSLIDKNVKDVRKLAATLGVSPQTIRRDIKAIRDERRTDLTKKSAPDHVSDMVAQMEEIAKNATADYIGIKGNSPRENAVKASLLQTALRAVMAKGQLLMQTGVVPPDITNVDRIIDAEIAEDRVKEVFDPKMAEVISNSESRRKIMDAIDKMKEIPADMADIILNKLDSKIGDNGNGKIAENNQEDKETS